MPIDLYYVLGSPPCRTVMMLAKDLKVDLNLKVTNLMAGDNKTPAYLKGGEKSYSCVLVTGSTCKAFVQDSTYKMPIDLYYELASPPCRTIIFLARTLGVELNLKFTDLGKGVHQTSAFLKMNPQHAIPTLDDNGFGLGESRAILRYLVDKYAKNDSLYPKDVKKRAIVDQRLDFDAGHLYNGFVTYYLVPILNTGKVGEKYWLDKLQENFNILNNILEGETWVAGNSITIADYAIAITVSTVELMGFDISKYSNVTKWYAKVQKAIPSYKEINDEGSKQLKEFFSQFQK